MINKLNIALKLPLICEHKHLGKGVITKVSQVPMSTDLLLHCNFTRSAAGLRWSFQRKTDIVAFENMYLCDKVYDALQDPRVVPYTMALLEKYAAEEPEQVSSSVAEQEELVTIEEVVAEMEAYYDQPAQEFKEAVVFAETEAVEEEPTAEITVEAIEELIQVPETDVDCEEAVEEANTTTETTVVSGRRSKKRRS
jgi:hypothetical protein